MALFSVGIPIFGLSPTLYRDMVAFCVVFGAGYALGSLRRRVSVPAHSAGVVVAGRGGSPGPAQGSTPAPEPHPPVPPLRRAEELLLVLLVAQLVVLAFNVGRYGIGGFYAGAALVDQLNSYGKASVGGGLFQVVSFFLRYVTLAVAVLYVQMCLSAGLEVRYRYLALLFILLPILSLARSDAVHGAGILLVINALERRVHTRHPPPGTEEALGARPRPRRALAFVVAAVIAVFAALVIGGIRQGRLVPDDPSAPLLERSAPLLQSEFSPLLAYGEIKDNEAILGHTYGSTVVLPLVLKVVPRGIFPGKPVNSAAYYMGHLRPDEFAAGYALPPTLFGDMFIGFGFLGPLAACLLLGAVVARLDVAYTRARLARVPWFLIVYANFYALLRSPLSESLAGILLTSIAWLMLRRRLTATPPKSAPRPRTRRLVGTGAVPTG